MEENVLCYTENFVKNRLIEKDKRINHHSIVNFKNLGEENTKKLVQLLEEGTNNNFMHRCVSVYRDAFIFEGDVYNICLSCGDYYKNDTRYYLNNTKQIKNFLNTFKND